MDFFEAQTGDSFRVRLAYGHDQGLVIVPGRATFGGWWTLDGGTPSRDDYAEAHDLFRHHVGRSKPIRMTLPPQYFRPQNFDPQRELFDALGHSLIEETNHTVVLEGQQLPELSRGNWKKIRQFRSIGRIVSASEESFRDCYNLLAASRRRRGVTLSLDRDQFILNLKRHPDRYHCFSAFIGERLVGVAYTVEISDDVTYVLYWGDSLEGRTYSVTASLFLEVREHAVALGKTFLDLGKSSVQGVLDNGLARFKENLGARPFPQQIWASQDFGLVS